MSYTAYPVDPDINAMLIGAGMITNPKTDVQAFLDISGARLKAIQDWEKETGLVPFLKDAADTTSYFDPPGDQGHDGIYGTQRGGGRSLYLPATSGSVYTSITSVMVGYSPTSAGTVLTVNQDYVLEPYNAALNNRPYEWITFAGRQFGPWRSIVVLGKRGWPIVPDDVLRVIKTKTIANLMPEIQAAVSEGLISWSEADGTKETYSGTPFDSSLNRYDLDWSRVVNRFKVVSL